MRLVKWLTGQAALQPHRKASENPIKLTPGQYSELVEEIGCGPRGTDHLRLATCQGTHDVIKLECDQKPIGENVILGARLDLFSETDAQVGLQMVSSANSVTSTPDNIGCCEVLGIGEKVTSVKPGDLVFIDLCDVKQGYICKNEEVYVAADGIFRGKYDAKTQAITPFNNYVLTKRNLERFKVAWLGTDRLHMPAHRLTEGVYGGKTSKGAVAAHVVYEEVVAVGKLTNRERPGLMTKVERQVLEAVVERSYCERDDLFQRPSETYYEEAVALFDALRKERARGREPDVQVGELVAFCKQLATPVRVRGEFCNLVPYEQILSGIDDEKILEDAIARNEAGSVIRAAS